MLVNVIKANKVRLMLDKLKKADKVPLLMACYPSCIPGRPRVWSSSLTARPSSAVTGQGALFIASVCHTTGVVEGEGGRAAPLKKASVGPPTDGRWQFEWDQWRWGAELSETGRFWARSWQLITDTRNCANHEKQIISEQGRGRP